MITIFLVLLSLISLKTFRNSTKLAQSSSLRLKQRFDYKTSLGTKSPYPANKSNVSIPDDLSKCEIQQIQVIGRHGARFWSTSDHLGFFKLAEFIRDNVDRTHPWFNLTIQFPYNSAGQLAPIGITKMKSFGKRINASYPQNIFADLTKLKVYSSETKRVYQSALHFLKGAFGINSSKVEILTVPKLQDKALNPTYSCKKYKTEKYKYYGRVQKELWKQTYVSELQERLSVFLNTTISKEQASLLLDLCVAQITLLGYMRYKGVCNIITDLDLTNYEIQSDLEKYYELAYAFDFNQKLACQLISDIHRDLFNTSRRAVLRFGHAETIVPLITSLGLFTGSNISATTPFKEIQKRSFYTGKIVPFGSNFILEAFECPRGKFIRSLLNEKPVDLPGCSIGGGLCTISDIDILLLNAGSGCNFDQICDN